MQSNKFSFSVRLKSPEEFRSVYSKGKKIVSAYFVLFFLRVGSESRLGITITKAVGKSNERNRIKRQVREYFRLNRRKLPIFDFVVKARMGATSADNKSLRTDLEKVFMKVAAQVGETK